MRMLLILMPLVLLGVAQGDDLRFARQSEVAGCLASVLSCNTTGTGEITAGDCTLGDGKRYDKWQFAGSVGQLVKVTLTPVDASLTRPTLYVFPPVGDASKTPTVAGAGSLTLWYLLSSTGTWNVIVGTLDLFGGGRYTLALECMVDPNPSLPQNCVSQDLACGQFGLWALTATSCRFGNTTQAYADYDVGHLVKGDSFVFAAHSDDFDPYISVYNSTTGSLLGSAFGKRSTTDAVLSFTAPTTDDFEVSVYGPTDTAGNFFVSRTNCFSSCTGPRIVTQPAPARIAAGGSYSGTVVATGTALQYEWFFGLPPDNRIAIGVKSSSPAMILTHVTKDRDVWVRVSNDCGSVNSASAHIFVDPARRHAAGR